jgi:nicotinamide mononucleotide transporter
MNKTNKYIWVLLTAVSVILFLASFQKWIEIGLTEVSGFITGAICVIFVVRQNIWNFPVGIANNVFFIILFLESRLYGDMALQIVYILLALLGWWQWIYGSKERSALKVSNTSVREILILFALGVILTTGLREYFIFIKDSAPFLDALTTVLSLIAQYMLNYKRIENWYVWIIADVIYVGLYIQKDLFLTAILYAIFIGLCISGLIAWRKSQLEISN